MLRIARGLYGAFVKLLRARGDSNTRPTRNACSERNTARKRCWQLARDLKAVEKRIARKLNPDELMQTFNRWYDVSNRHLDPKKTRDHYLAAFLAGIGKVRVPTGDSD